jgi:2-dehydro-3-deoxygluconokinase
MNLNIKSAGQNTWDLVSLGEILLRFDPENERIHNARSFRVFDGGAEYNVARGLSKVFRRKTAIVTALADNALGRLAEDFAISAGVDCSKVLWRKHDGIGANTRNGLYFIERGFGIRPPNSTFDRDNTAVSQIKADDLDWQKITQKTRWLHTGGVFAALSETTPEVAQAAMKAAQKNGAIVSYDLNYRNSLWKNRGGIEAANELNKKFLPFADIIFGVLTKDFNSSAADFDEESFRRSTEKMCADFPNIKIVASTLRDVQSANCHNFSAVCYADGEIFTAQNYENTEIADRVGSGDSFDSGFIDALLSGKDLDFAVNCGAAHGALAMTTFGDNSMATADEVFDLMEGKGAGAIR